MSWNQTSYCLINVCSCSRITGAQDLHGQDWRAAGRLRDLHAAGHRRDPQVLRGPAVQHLCQAVLLERLSAESDGCGSRWEQVGEGVRGVLRSRGACPSAAAAVPEVGVPRFGACPGHVRESGRLAYIKRTSSGQVGVRKTNVQNLFLIWVGRSVGKFWERRPK